MRHYEVTFIVDPVLSGDEIKTTAQNYVDQLKELGCGIVHKDEMGLKQLAYPINRRTSGVYFCIEYTTETGEVIKPLELSLRRDERILRFLTAKLDKYGVKYNDDKRKGLIGKKREKATDEVEEEAKQEKARKNAKQQDKKEQEKKAKLKEAEAEAKEAEAKAVKAKEAEAKAKEAEAKAVKAKEAEAKEAEAKEAEAEAKAVKVVEEEE